MGKLVKKGTKGEQSQYITRSKAIRKLQLSLKDFRRLCILKGVYPREPKKKFEGSNKSYYHVKDIKILAHEKLLDKFRDIKAHLKKHKRLLNRKELDLAKSHMDKKPKYTLNHIIKERYPSFVDALRDLDDALCMIALFANFPQHQSLDIKQEDIAKCQTLSREFMTYCAATQCFKRAFYSIKGIYYQVEIMGQTITWVQPYQFNQKLPFDIDYRVMGTFLEFYLSLLKFINFKLFSDIKEEYPLKEALFDSEMVLNVDAFKNMQVRARKLIQENQGKDGKSFQVSEEFKDTPEMKEIGKKEELSRKQRDLFKNLTFYFNREAPIYSLQYLVLSFGGVFGHDGENSKFNSEHKSITHHIFDRPLTSEQKSSLKKLNRELVQPQWIIDSLNNVHNLPTAQYFPGVPPPAHLSPFLDNKKEGYMPDRAKEIQRLKGEDIEESEDEPT
jgi:pescadillo protein